MKQLIFFIVVISFLSFSHTADAQTLSKAKQEAINDRIEALYAQIQKLQRQLALLESKKPTAAEFSYKTKFYKGKYEALYQVDGETLIPQKGTSVRSSDQLLWNTFAEIVGEDFIEDAISEFRIYSNSNTEISAFVEKKPNGTWILGFNREGQDITNIHNDESIIDLLIHEYGHIVFFSNSSYEKDFKKTFWDTKQSSNDFVTEYASNNVTEDLAESFVYFVREDKPTATGKKYDKIRFFYNYPKLVTLRAELRKSDHI